MIPLKTPAHIEAMREAGRRLAGVVEVLRDEVMVGLKTLDLDRRAHELIEAAGAEPAFLGYRATGSREAYPFTICLSLNDVVVHGRPSSYELREGDLVKLDLGLRYRGWYVDTATTVVVGKPSELQKKLVAVTEEALRLAIQEAQVGNTVGDISSVVERYVVKNKFSVVKTLTGHGIGRALHEEPSVPNFGKSGEGAVLEAGMVLAIEPMVASGWGEDSSKTKQLPDDSFVTADGSLSAHFEHTVAITPDGPEILTKLES